MNNQHIITLEHAAKISPFVHNRSIGADAVPLCHEETGHCSKDVMKPDKSAIRQVKSPANEKKSLPLMAYRELNSLQVKRNALRV